MISESALAAARSRPARSPLRAEFGAMLALAAPLALTQLGQILIHGTEVVLLGRLGAAPLASVTLAWTLFFACFIGAMGIVQATAPLIAIARGAGRPDEVRRAVRQGLWVAFLVTLPLGALLWYGRPILRLLGQDEELLVGSETYLRAVVFGLPPAAAFIVLRNFVSAYGRTTPVMLVTFATVGINIVLSAGLVFGLMGLPRLEVLGAGIGAAVSWATMFGLLLAWCLLSPSFRGFRLLHRFWHPDWRVFGEIVRIGLPIGAAMLMETGLFAASTLMMGRIGTAALAAHQVALQLAATAFMVPLGISIAATIRIGIAVGAGDAPGVRRAGWLAAGMGSVFMTSTALLFWLAGPRLTALFFDPSIAGAAAAMAIAATLIRFAALFQLVDGLQVIGIANLRGMKDTSVPMALAGFGYWLLGVPACALLGFATPLGAKGIWLGLAIGLAVVASAMLLRFARLTAPGRLERRLATPFN